MVTTVIRVLTTILAATLLVLGAPLTQDVSAQSVPEAQSARHIAEVASGSSTASTQAHVSHDKAVVSSALPNWSGDHRVILHGIPDGYLPGQGLLPDLGASWARAPLPESAQVPDLDDTAGLPLGRDPPPLTAHV